MAMFPLISNFEGDFVLQLVAVDTENTMDEVAAAAAHHSVGRRVKRRPGHVIRVRKQGSKDLFARTTRVSESGLKPMECLEFVWESPAVSSASV
jgi:toluene monooxygenase system protein B